MSQLGSKKRVIRSHGHKTAPKTPQKATRRSQDAPKTAFETVLGLCWAALGALLGHISVINRPKRLQEGPRGPNIGSWERSRGYAATYLRFDRFQDAERDGKNDVMYVEKVRFT